MAFSINKQRTNLLIIPFFNEEKCFQKDKFHSLLAGEEFDILFVNDGSIDSVPEQIRLQFIRNYTIMPCQVSSHRLLQFSTNRYVS